MKSPRFLWRLFLILLLCNVNTFGQSDNPILSMNVEVVPVKNYISPDSLLVIADSTVYGMRMNLNHYDKTKIQTKEVNIASTEGGTEYLSQVFTFDVSGSLGGDFSYMMNDYFVELGIGEPIGVSSNFAAKEFASLFM